MTHEEAVENRAADRYLLAELTPVERVEFEEHYFECPECAAEVRAGAAFTANARAILAEEAGRRLTHRPATPNVRGLLGWRRPVFALAWAAAAVFAVINVVQWMRVERAEGPQAYPAFFLRGTARGDDQVLRAPTASRYLGLSFDVPPGGGRAVYRCVLLDEARRQRFSIDVEAPSEPGAAVNVLVPVSGMVSGRYTLVLYRGSAELGRYPFELQLQ